jgi:uncharacterized protein YkwD
MLSARLVRGATWLLAIGVAGVRLVFAPAGLAAPKARSASRACAFQDAPAGAAPASDLRNAAVCLINVTRTARGLPPLRQRPRLDFAAQGHASEMVARREFSHTGADGSPGARLDHVGFRWSALGEDISTGFTTPLQAVWGWLASPDHCRILLAPTYRDIGVGVEGRPVRGWANRPGTWTADFALPRGSGSPSGDWAPAAGCPY